MLGGRNKCFTIGHKLDFGKSHLIACYFHELTTSIHPSIHPGMIERCYSWVMTPESLEQIRRNRVLHQCFFGAAGWLENIMPRPWRATTQCILCRRKNAALVPTMCALSVPSQNTHLGALWKTTTHHPVQDLSLSRRTDGQRRCSPCPFLWPP